MHRFKVRRLKKLILLALMQRRRKRQREKRPRTIHIRKLFQNRQEHGEDVLIADLRRDPLYHKKYFRMSKETFDILFKLVKDDLEHPMTHRYPISPLLRLAVTLRFLATGASQQHMAIDYRISPSAIGIIIRETMTLLIKKLRPMYLPEPNLETWLASEKTFREKWNFPLCVGAIDGKHVRVKAPTKSGSLYFNYKGFFSYAVLAIADANYCFLAADIGAPGSESDAGIFSHSNLGKKFERGIMGLPEEQALLPDVFLPHVIVGDEGLPLKPYMMRPFPKLDPDINNRVFNYRLSRARRVVENAFGIWASRFRILHTPINAKEDLVLLIIECTLILHNFLRKLGDNNDITIDCETAEGGVLPGNWRGNSPVGVTELRRLGSNNYSRSASQIRDLFKEYFLSEEGKLPWQNERVHRGFISGIM